MSDERGPSSFGSLRDGSVPALLRDLQEAETAHDWNAVLVRMVDELAIHEAGARQIYDNLFPKAVRADFESKWNRLRLLVGRGFQSPPRRPREIARAREDAHVIATWSSARTVAEAVAFLRKAYLLSDTQARSRVRLARTVGGLRLVAASRGGARARKGRPSK